MSGHKVEEPFRQLLEAVPDAMLVVDQHGVVRLANTLALRMFGYAARELLGQPVELLLPERLRSRHGHLRSAYSAAPTVRPMGVGLELVGRRRDGSEFPAEISLGPFPTDEGVLVFSAIRDLTERKQAEATLRHQQAQLLAAQTIQRYLLPSGPPQVPGLDIAGASYPADFAAGDHFDYLTLPHGALGFVVGDVSGHGFAAALFMAAVQARLRALAETSIGIDEILARANAALVNESGPGTFVTVFFGCLDLRTKTFVYASAGHPTGYVLDAAGQVKAHLKSTSLPLAILADAKFPLAGPLALQSGDILLLLTDGVLESQAATGENFGAERTLQVLRANRGRAAQEILERLHQAVCGFAAGARPQDDVTAVVIKVQ